MAPPYNAGIRGRVLSLYEDTDKTYKEIQEVTGVSVASITSWIREAREKRGFQPRRARRLPSTSPQIKRALSFVENGCTYRYAGEEVGLKKSTVHYWCKHFGVRSRIGKKKIRNRIARAKQILVIPNITEAAGKHIHQ